jgi:hypothetical protein
MFDTHAHTDHRRHAAMLTDQGSHRGWNFDNAVDDGPMWLRALAEIARPRSIIILAIMAGTLSLLWIG